VSGRSNPSFSYYARGTSLKWHQGVYFPTDTLRALRQFDSVLQNAVPLWLIFSHPSDDGRERLLSRVGPDRRVELVHERGFVALYRVE
jgi:hypothetical protein